MTHRHAYRRGVVARPSDKDLRTLRRLVVRAEKAAADPAGKGLPFVVAAEKAWRAVLPIGFRGADQCFIQLIRIGKGEGRPDGKSTFLTLTGDARSAAVARMPDLANQCRAALDAIETQAGGARQRKDIDG